MKRTLKKIIGFAMLAMIPIAFIVGLFYQLGFKYGIIAILCIAALLGFVFLATYLIDSE